MYELAASVEVDDVEVIIISEAFEGAVRSVCSVCTLITDIIVDVE